MSEESNWDVAAELAKLNGSVSRNTPARHTVHNVTTATANRPQNSPRNVKNPVSDHQLGNAKALTVRTAHDAVASALQPHFTGDSLEAKGRKNTTIRLTDKLDGTQEEKFVMFMVMNTAELGYNKSSMLMAAIRWGLRDLPVTNGQVFHHSTIPAGYDDALLRFKLLYNNNEALVRFLATTKVALAIFAGTNFRDLASAYRGADTDNHSRLAGDLGVEIVGKAKEFKLVFGESVQPFISELTAKRRITETQNTALAYITTVTLYTKDATTSLEVLTRTRHIIKNLMNEGFMDVTSHVVVELIDTDVITNEVDKAAAVAKNHSKHEQNYFSKRAIANILEFRLKFMAFDMIVSSMCTRLKDADYCNHCVCMSSVFGGDASEGLGFVILAIAYLKHKFGIGENISPCFAKISAHFNTQIQGIMIGLSKCNRNEQRVEHVNDSVGVYSAELDELFDPFLD